MIDWDKAKNAAKTKDNTTLSQMKAQVSQMPKAQTANTTPVQQTPLMQKLSTGGVPERLSPLARLKSGSDIIGKTAETDAPKPLKSNYKPMITNNVIETNPYSTGIENAAYKLGTAIGNKNPNTIPGSVGYGLAKGVQGAVGAVEGITDLIYGGGSTALGWLTSLGGLAPNSFSQGFYDNADKVYKTDVSGAVGQGIADKSEVEIAKPIKFAGDVYNVAGNMLTGIGTGKAVTGATKLASNIAGKLAIGASAGGNAAQQASQEGADAKKASIYGLSSGLLEATIESIAGGIPGLGKGVIVEAINKKMPGAVEKLIDVLGEGAEEVLSDFISPYIQRIVYNPDAKNATLEEMATDFVMGAGLSGIMQGASAVGNIKLPTAKPTNPIAPNLATKNTANITEDTTKTSANVAPNLNTAVEEGKANNHDKLPQGVGANSSEFADYTHAESKYGAIPQGEEVRSRTVEMPKQMNDSTVVSKAARTAAEATVTTDEAYDDIRRGVQDERFSFKTIKDKDSTARATKTINSKGWDTAVKDWTAEARSGKVSKDLIVMGQTLYNNAVNSGHTKEGIDILVDLVKMSRSGAQATQANRILKKMSPEGQLYALQRSVDNLTDELSTKVPNGIKINKDLADAYLKAETEEARSKAMDALKDDVAKQIPSNWLDKWNAWRYLSMLGNPRTHIRNILGNAFFAPVRGTKNLIATGIEKATGTEHKTKSVLTSKDADLKNAAKADYDAHADEVLENGKFNDSRTDLESRKTVFKFKALESVRKANDTALNKEDSWFARPAYANALASYCKANGITAEELANGNSEKIDEARAYATREAQKATYRDCNAFSDWVASLGKNSKSTNKVAKLANVAIEGILPFKRTPANILARAVEYSPVGLVKGLTSDLVQVQKGNMEAWEAIDNISAGLTGTMLVGAGAFLSSLGLISGGASDDDKERTIDGLEGLQNYALNVGGKTITLDWLAPEALPLFVGVELFNTIKNKDDGEVTLSSVLTKIGNIAEPMLEMSMLQGVNDLFDSIKYSESNSVLSILATLAVNYLSQGLPTLFGQIERITEKERESTFVDNTSGVPASVQRMLGKAANKIPLLDYQQTPYVNALGNHQSSGSVWERIFSNSISPAYLSNKTDSAVTAELRRLNENHALTTYPQTADRYFDYDGKQYNMSADEYVKFEETGGKYANEYMSEAIKSNWYKTLNDEQKDAVLSNLQGYAKDKAKQAVIGNNYKSPELYKAAHKAEEKGISPTNFYTYKSALNQIDKNGSATQLESAQALQKTSMSNSEKGKLWALQNDDSDKNPYTGKLSQYGFSASQSIKIMEAYNKVKEEVESSYVKPDGGAGVKSVCASYFEKWLRQNGYSSKQIENITDTYIYWNMIPAKTTKKSQRYVASRGMIIS